MFEFKHLKKNICVLKKGIFELLDFSALQAGTAGTIKKELKYHPHNGHYKFYISFNNGDEGHVTNALHVFAARVVSRF